MAGGRRLQGPPKAGTAVPTNKRRGCLARGRVDSVLKNHAWRSLNFGNWSISCGFMAENVNLTW